MNQPEINNKSATSANQVCVARQPILDRHCNVVAYELLFRKPGDTDAVIDDDDDATINVINNAFTNIGIETLLGGKKAYINFNASLLKGDIARILPHDKVVLEMLKTVKMDDSLLARLRGLHSEGYRFALGDFIHQKDSDYLYPFADIVKLDISQTEKNTLVQQVENLLNLNKTLLAEKVENQNAFELCKSLGFKLFQGYFFAKPVVVTQEELPASKRHLIDIMNAVMDDADNRLIEDKIIHDVSLSYKLLKFVNSAGLSRGQELASINTALSMIGRKQLYRWLSILMFSTDDSGKRQPNAIFKAAIYRGRLMEILGEITQHQNPADLFVLGTFSYLEALLQRKLTWLLKDMLVPPPIKDALLDNAGEYWPYLELAIELDNGKFDGAYITTAGLTIDQINQAQLSATAYSESIT